MAKYSLPARALVLRSLRTFEGRVEVDAACSMRCCSLVTAGVTGLSGGSEGIHWKEAPPKPCEAEGNAMSRGIVVSAYLMSEV
eukprot:8334613-Pyramimonas_sp.AAC.1